MAGEGRVGAARLDEPGPAFAGTDDQRPPTWRGWPGGLAMLVVVLAPQILDALVPVRLLHVQLGAHVTMDLGALLAASPGMAAFGLVARLVGYRRRDVVLMAMPILNVYLAWITGARWIQLRPGDAPERWRGSQEGATAAVVVQGLVITLYLSWVLVIEILALP